VVDRSLTILADQTTKQEDHTRERVVVEEEEEDHERVAGDPSQVHRCSPAAAVDREVGPTPKHHLEDPGEVGPTPGEVVVVAQADREVVGPTLGGVEVHPMRGHRVVVQAEAGHPTLKRLVAVHVLGVIGPTLAGLVVVHYEVHPNLVVLDHPSHLVAVRDCPTVGQVVQMTSRLGGHPFPTQFEVVLTDRHLHHSIHVCNSLKKERKRKGGRKKKGKKGGRK